MAEGDGFVLQGSDPAVAEGLNGLEDLVIAGTESSASCDSRGSSEPGDSSSDGEASAPDLAALWPVQARDVLRRPSGKQVPKPTKSHKKQPKEVQRTNKERRKERVKVC